MDGMSRRVISWEDLLSTTMTTGETRRKIFAYAGNVLFHNFIVCLFVVVYWRSTWTIVDLFLFPDNAALNALLSLGMGVLITLSGTLGQDILEKYMLDSRTVSFIAVSRSYTYIKSWGSVFLWRGVWKLLDMYTGMTLSSAFTCVFVSTTLLVILKALKSIVSQPFFADVDFDRQNYFTVITRFSIKVSSFYSDKTRIDTRD